MFTDLFSDLNVSYFFGSAILFLAGVYFGPSAVEADRDLLLRYPRWIARKTLQYFRPQYHFMVMFAIIFFMNNLSLLTSFISGFLIVIPLLAAFFTGFNVAVIIFDHAGWQGIWSILMNPVAWLEFPASWFSFALGLQLSEKMLETFDFAAGLVTFTALLPAYLKYVVILLFFAAMLETAMIKFATHFESGEDE